MKHRAKGNVVTYLSENLEMISDGQFGWGAAPLIIKQRNAMASSIGSEIQCRVQKQKLA